jgi:hypothetical protein
LMTNIFIVLGWAISSATLAKKVTFYAHFCKLFVFYAKFLLFFRLSS